MRIVITFFFAVFAAACTRQPAEPVIKTLRAEQYDSLIASKTGNKAVLVNVWATWCGPCVEEFPDLVKLALKYEKEAEVVFISADFPDQLAPVKAFLQQQGVDWTTYVKDDADETFINAVDHQWTGSIPVTIIYNRKGDKAYFEEGKGTFALFEKALLSAINQ